MWNFCHASHLIDLGIEMPHSQMPLYDNVRLHSSIGLDSICGSRTRHICFRQPGPIWTCGLRFLLLLIMLLPKLVSALDYCQAVNGDNILVHVLQSAVRCVLTVHNDGDCHNPQTHTHTQTPCFKLSAVRRSFLHEQCIHMATGGLFKVQDHNAWLASCLWETSSAVTSDWQAHCNTVMLSTDRWAWPGVLTWTKSSGAFSRRICFLCSRSSATMQCTCDNTSMLPELVRPDILVTC